MLNRLMESVGASSQRDLALRLGLPPSSITDALRRGNIPEDWLYRVAYLTGKSVEWLKTGKGDALHLLTMHEGGRARYGQPGIPLLSFIQAGELTSSLDPYPYAGVAEEYIAADVKGDRCIALRVRGESMLPEFHEKDIIVVDLGQREPQSGDYVVARVDEKEEATFKLYLKKRDGTVLKPLNDAYKEIPFVPDHRIVGKVVRLIRAY